VIIHNVKVYLFFLQPLTWITVLLIIITDPG
jgi:hypothetical protein